MDTWPLHDTWPFRSSRWALPPNGLPNVPGVAQALEVAEVGVDVLGGRFKLRLLLVNFFWVY